MSEEVKLKVNVPLFEEKELEIFDNNLHSIIEEYSKLHLEKQEQILTQRVIIKQEEEINKLIAKSIEWESKCYKQKEVIDKIKDKCLENMYIDDRGEEVESIEIDIKPSEILELLEEIE